MSKSPKSKQNKVTRFFDKLFSNDKDKSNIEQTRSSATSLPHLSASARLTEKGKVT